MCELNCAMCDVRCAVYGVQGRREQQCVSQFSAGKGRLLKQVRPSPTAAPDNDSLVCLSDQPVASTATLPAAGSSGMGRRHARRLPQLPVPARRPVPWYSRAPPPPAANQQHMHSAPATSSQPPPHQPLSSPATTGLLRPS